jgi:hypothetical protein
MESEEPNHMSDNGCTANWPEEMNGNTSITNWLKSCIKGLEVAEPNQGSENLEMTIELRDSIVENLKNLDEYVTWLQKAYDKEIKKPDIYSNPSLEFLSEQVHNAWWDEKKRQGFHAPLVCPDYVMGGEISVNFKFNKLCDRCHTDCYPYSELPEHIKDYDRVTVRTVLEAIKKMEEV